MTKNTHNPLFAVATSLVAISLFSCIVHVPQHNARSTNALAAEIVQNTATDPIILSPTSNSPYCSAFQGYFICEKHPSGLSTVWWSQKLSKGRYEIFAYWEAIYPPKDRLATYRISPYGEKEVLLTVNQKNASQGDLTMSAPRTKCSLPWCDGRMMNFQRLGEFSIAQASVTTFVGMAGKSDFSVIGHALAIRRIGDALTAASSPPSSSSAASSVTSSASSTGGSSPASERLIALLDATLTCQGTINVSFVKKVPQNCLTLIDEGTNIHRATVCGQSGTAWSVEQTPPTTSLLEEGRKVVLTTGGKNAVFSLPISLKKTPCASTIPAPAGTIIFDDADKNFSTMPSWNYSCSTLQDLRAYKGAHTHCPSMSIGQSIVAAPTGTWSMENLAPGKYDVYATWIPSKESGLNASLSMVNGIYPIGIGTMTQQDPPVISPGFSVGTTTFALIGSLTVPQSGKISITAIGSTPDKPRRMSIDAIALVLRERSSSSPAFSSTSSSTQSTSSSGTCQACASSQGNAVSSSTTPVPFPSPEIKRIIVDDSSMFGFISTGNTFKRMSVTNATTIISRSYKGTVSLYSGTSVQTARYNIGTLPAGSYIAYATWPTSSTFVGSTKTGYNIFVGAINGTPVAKSSVNQQSAPSEMTYDGTSWNAIGSFTVLSPSPVTIAVQSGDNTTFADAVMVVSTSGPTR